MGERVLVSDDGACRDNVISDSGVRIAVQVAGPPDAPPVVLLHGWAQSGRAWTRQLLGPLSASFRLVAADLRGHGDSDVPAGGYHDGDEWAEDVRAILAYAGEPAVLVGWSYGGLVIMDYMRSFGSTGMAGLVLVGAVTEIGRGNEGGRIGPVMRAALPAALSDDLGVAQPALREFVAGMSTVDSPDWLVEEALRVPAFVRAALFDRDEVSTDVLISVDVPTLVVHGRQDRVVDPSAAQYAADMIPGATLTWLDTGHLPFMEDQEGFDTALAAHADRCFGRAA